MIKQRQRPAAMLSLATDFVALLAAFFTAWYLRFGGLLDWNDVHPQPPLATYLRLLPAAVIIWPIVFHFQGLYRSRRGRSRIEELLSVLLAVVFAGLLLTGFTVWYRFPQFPGSELDFAPSRLFLGFFFSINVLLTTAGRLIIRDVLRYRRRQGKGVLRILVVGAGRLGQEVTQKILNHRALGLEVVGFLDDQPKPQPILGRPVLGTLDDLQHVLTEQAIDQVLIALPLEAHRKTLRLLEHIGKECVEVRIVPDVLQYTALTASLEDLDGTPLINLSQVPLEGWNSMVKRMMDIGLSAAALIVTAPLFPIIAIAIWLEDRGPALYRQERMGLDGRTFQILKFRSMQINAESSTGPIWATPEDPRRTRVGAFLRRTSLDELPQLWNVFRGEMSVVGPRPERPAFVEEFKHQIPQYMQRHRVKAGITGWAQVHGWRGNTSLRKRIQYDIYYIENWSLLLDLKILWMTLRHGLRHSNAY